MPEPQATPVAPPPVKAGLPSSFTGISINGHSHDVVPLVKRKAESLTQQRLEELWNMLIENSKEDEKLTELLADKKLEVVDDNHFRIWVNNLYFTSVFRQYQTLILRFLREQTANENLVFTVQLVPQDQQEWKPYTARDKYEFMVERNPSLTTLRELFPDIDL